MKTPLALSAFALVASLLASSAALAAPKTYQVTGQVVEVNPDNVVVLTVKGKEKWQVEKDAATKSTGGDVKVGDKVTIEYRMLATSIENKGGGKAAPADKAAPAAAPAAAKAPEKKPAK